MSTHFSRHQDKIKNIRISRPVDTLQQQLCTHAHQPCTHATTTAMPGFRQKCSEHFPWVSLSFHSSNHIIFTEWSSKWIPFSLSSSPIKMCRRSSIKDVRTFSTNFDPLSLSRGLSTFVPPPPPPPPPPSARLCPHYPTLHMEVLSFP